MIFQPPILILGKVKQILMNQMWMHSSSSSELGSGSGIGMIEALAGQVAYIGRLDVVEDVSVGGTPVMVRQPNEMNVVEGAGKTITVVSSGHPVGKVIVVVVGWVAVTVVVNGQNEPP